MNEEQFDVSLLKDNLECNKIITINGSVKSGIHEGNIINMNNYIIKLYICYDYNTVLIQQIKSDLNGNFFLKINEKILVGNFVLYVTAEKNNIKLLSILGDKKHSLKIVINEVTTISGIYTLSQFYNGDMIFGPIKSLQIASMMYFNLTTLIGTFSNIICSNPNANETNTLKKINNLCNLLGLTIRNEHTFFLLNELTIKKKTNTLDCIHYISQNPINNVIQLYNLSSKIKIYTNTLTKPPQNLLLAIKFNKSGNNKYLFGGPANIYFDKNNNVWITNNVVQGKTISSNFAIVLKPNGEPCDFSPVLNGGILGSGFGIINDKENNIIISNYGWGGLLPYPSGSISKFKTNGQAITPSAREGNSGGNQKGIYRVQGLQVDKYNNLWIASAGNNRVVVYINCDENNLRYYQVKNGTLFDNTTDHNKSHVYFSSRKDNTNNKSGEILQFTFNKTTNSIVLKKEYIGNQGESFYGITTDAHDNVYANASNLNSVYKFDKDLNLLQIITGGGLSSPWGNFMDSGNNLFVANFGSNSNGLFCFSHFRNDGKALSPRNGFVLESGGNQVRLTTGDPLYGNIDKPCFKPFIRQTGLNVDIAGNLWVCNNWKPDPEIDATTNPGGDGMVVFIGYAKPSNIKI